ncbi:PREDICTED: uncharacterized protein LOC108968702 isoform X1 [Bactrocera latifrons]|uniref:uncharacterized protein LOC108968702 isoform X1 n=2 Tax=Bactrocera latifrons TaxID=174628 RepID=UPI0008DDA25B|nr:PREDICTED: uncharacterized protein LOC108968702 isoform X1 [Bactrocera latifrons]
MQKRNVIYVHNGNLIQQADKNPAVRGRASLTHSLIASYGLLKHMQRLEPRICKYTDLRRFHNSAYVEELLKKATLSKTKSTTNVFVKQKMLNDTLEEACSSSGDDEDNNCALDTTLTHIEYGLGFDCPSWRGVWEYACTVAGGTMSACVALCKYGVTNNSEQTIIINWTGGWHHAQRDRAAGYCYVNDIVLGILVLRKHFKRVLYVDLDAHHGDGVQQAFEVTKRVFTFSMHRYECGYYPGTGGMDDCGFGEGKGYAANFPYQSGIGGKNFYKYLKRVLTKILQLYNPEVCVIQCGADALVGDPLGGTNLTPADLIECVEFILMNGLPTVLLGGGGYNFTNSSRLWTQLTATCCGVPLPEDIPADNSDFLKYGPDYSVHIKASNFMKDHNNTEYLEVCANSIEGTNEKDILTSISPDGTVIISSRIKATLYCWMNLQKFPFDEQHCSTILESWMYNTSELVLHWEQKRPITLDPALHLTEYMQHGAWSNETVVNADLNDLRHGAFAGNYSSLSFTVHLTRQVGFYVMDYFLPSMLIVAISWVSFWLQADQAPPRIMLGTSTMLTFITLASAQGKTLPKVSYIKVSEVWFLGCTLFIFGSLIEFAFVNTIWRRKRNVDVKKMNSKHILKSTLSPRSKRRATGRSRSFCVPPASTQKENDPFNNYLTVHNIPINTIHEHEAVDNLSKSTSFSSTTLNTGDSMPYKKADLASVEMGEAQHNIGWTTLTPQEISMWIDRKARCVFPLAFLVFNAFFWTFVYVV